MVKRSWWCRLGLHHFYFSRTPGIYVCMRQGCDETEVGYL